MQIPKQYFNDKQILILLAVILLLAFASSIMILVRLGGAEDYVVQYRSNLGIGSFVTGSTINFIYFVIFNFFVVLFHTFMSMKMHTEGRHYSLLVLGAAVLLLGLVFFVSNALLMLS
jgi:hypothetical protein